MRLQIFFISFLISFNANAAFVQLGWEGSIKERTKDGRHGFIKRPAEEAAFICVADLK